MTQPVIPGFVGALKEAPPAIGRHTLISQDLNPPPHRHHHPQLSMTPAGIAVRDLPGNPLAADIQFPQNSKNKEKRLGVGHSQQRRAFGDGSGWEA